MGRLREADVPDLARLSTSSAPSVDPTSSEETSGVDANCSKRVADKVRYIGLSEAVHRSAASRGGGLDHEPPKRYSLLERGVETEVIDTCAELGDRVPGICAARSGLLAGSLKPRASWRRATPAPVVSAARRAGHLFRECWLARVVEEIASEHQATSAQSL